MTGGEAGKDEIQELILYLKILAPLAALLNIAYFRTMLYGSENFVVFSLG